MGRTRRSFTIGFKQQVVTEIKAGELNIGQACRKYDLSYSTVCSWIKKFDEGQLTGKPSTEELSLKAENEKLKAKVGELTMQIDLLKKYNNWIQQRRNADSSVVTGKNLKQFVKGAKCSK